ncbi:MAG: hypothetical protein HY927_14830 [Elusimicrobia bacterium]|nr:hypothetical protein [Elusimicrobiota bacterium]
MAHAYTPGLKVVPSIRLRRRRLLPIPGEVLVKEGDRVSARDIVAQTKLPGKVHLVNVANRLGIPPDETRRHMLKKEGEEVFANDVLAQNEPWFKFMQTTIPSPVTGSVESISDITGQVMLREPPRLLKLSAYIDGRVVEVMRGSGVVVESEGSFIQGIFGVGGEAHGPITVVVESPGQELLPELLTESVRGQVVVGGAHASWETLQKAKAVGASGIVVGGINDKDLRQLLGYDIGVAVTGQETIGFTLIVTEGFGSITMAEHTFDLLKRRQGHQASISGATQIRAGVLRPEIIVPGVLEGKASDATERGAIQVGDPVRVIREPHFGVIGKVSALPSELTKIATESKVRIMEVSLGTGERIVVPRANVELLER